VALIFLLGIPIPYFKDQSALAAQLKLAWDANTEPALEGYKVYYGTASRSYGRPVNVGKVTTYILTGLTLGQTYYVAVTAYDKSNNESRYSNEVKGAATDGAPVTSVQSKQGAEKKPQAEWMAVSESFVIGPEDVLSIHVWKEEALSRTVPVRTDGKISLPLIDDIQAAGYTARQLKDVLTKRLKEFIENPVVSVTVTEANSYKVYVSGQVRTPGVYRLRNETTILQIIPMAGGFTDWANQKKILIIRKEDGKEQRLTVNYKKILKGDASESNTILRPGDTVIVP
jgi:polysaccharide export outer membrane protein